MEIIAEVESVAGQFVRFAPKSLVDGGFFKKGPGRLVGEEMPDARAQEDDQKQGREPEDRDVS